MSDTGALAQISQARRFLEQAKDLTDIKAVKNMAEAARLYARARRLGLETENAAAEIKVRADRKLGEALAAGKQNQGGRPAGTPRPGRGVSREPTLAELGISYDESSNAKAIASLPSDVFEGVISETKEAGKPLATKPLVREGRKRKREQAATSMRRGRAEPLPRDGRPSPVNTQNLLDAQLRKSFAAWLVGVANICAVDPSRVLEVLALPAAEHADASLARLCLWAERFKSARVDAGRPRVVGRAHG